MFENIVNHVVQITSADNRNEGYFHVVTVNFLNDETWKRLFSNATKQTAPAQILHAEHSEGSLQ